MNERKIETERMLDDALKLVGTLTAKVAEMEERLLRHERRTIESINAAEDRIERRCRDNEASIKGIRDDLDRLL